MRIALSVLLVANLISGCSSVASSGVLLPFPNPYRPVSGYSESTPIWQMDFEGSGCDDGSSNAFYSCAVANGADPDCSTGSCPLEQTKSGFLQGIDTIQTAEPFPYGTSGSGNPDSGEMTLDFLIKMVGDSGQNTSAIGVSHISLAGLYDGSTPRCFIAYNPASNKLHLKGVESADSTALSLGVTYRVRMTYISAYKLCGVKVSTVAANNWHAGNIMSENSFLGTGAPFHPVDNLRFHQVGGTASDLNRFVVDDVVLCRGNIFGSTQCDEE